MREAKTASREHFSKSPYPGIIANIRAIRGRRRDRGNGRGQSAPPVLGIWDREERIYADAPMPDSSQPMPVCNILTCRTLSYSYSQQLMAAEYAPPVVWPASPPVPRIPNGGLFAADLKLGDGMRFLGDLFRLNARRFGNKPALIFEDQVASFEDLDRYAVSIGNLLLEHGVVSGDRVVLLAENCFEFMPIFHGIVKIGAVSVPLNYRCTAKELEYMLADSAPSAVFYTDAQTAMIDALADSLHGVRLFRIEQALLRGSATPLPPLPVDFDENHAALIMYTSGTTGTPKGAALPHRAIVEQMAATALAMGVREPDIVLVTVPLFHGGGMFVVSHPHFYVGASVVLTARYKAEEVIGLVDRHDITTFFGVPSQFTMLINTVQAGAVPRSLTKAIYGAAPMPLELIRRSQQFWPGIRFTQAYGQTEVTLTTVLSPEDHDRKISTVGRELPNVEMRVVDGQGRDCPPLIVGEIVVNAEAGMIGYLNNPQQTRDTIRDGWIYTGDLGFLDENGFLTLSGRKRDVIVSGGENIYPKEIEEVLAQHPAVSEVAVVGGPDEKWGEVPVAFVIGRGDAVTPVDLEEWCTQRLARYKIPRNWQFVADFPRTANGKIRKAELQKLLARVQ